MGEGPSNTLTLERERMRKPVFLVLLLALLTPTAPVAGQVEISARAANLRLGGRLHAQFASSSAEDGTGADMFLRRARLIADLRITDLLDGRLQTDFAGGQAQVQDAYFRLNFDPGFRISFGQFKRAFDPFELASSTELPVIERDGRVSGIGDCAGVGGACSLSRFTEKLAYAGRDMGIRLEGAASGGKVSYQASLTNGTGLNVGDENDTKSVAGRLVFEVGEGVRLAANASVHDYANPADEEDTDYGTAWGGDVEIGDYRDGLHVQAGVIAGDNWKSTDPTTGAVPGFVTAQGIISFYAPLADDPRFSAIEPLARVSWGDPDADLDDDAAVIFTPGLMLYVSGRNRIGANVDIYRPQDGDTDYSVKVQAFLYF